MNDENTMKTQLVMELAALQGKDPRKITTGDKDLKKSIQTNLEHILVKNSYKLCDVPVNVGFDPKQKRDVHDLTKFNLRIDDADQMDDQAEIEQIKAKTMARKINAQQKELTMLYEEKTIENNEIQFEIGINTNKRGKKDYIRHNIIRVLDQKSMIKMIMEANPPLVSQNVPFLSNSTGFTRTELHTLYSMYKALCFATSQRCGIMEYDVEDGIDEPVFRKGVYQVFIQSDFIAKRIFHTIDYNFSKYMNWPEFIDGMQMIKAKTLTEKIGLFIKVDLR